MRYAYRTILMAGMVIPCMLGMILAIAKTGYVAGYATMLDAIDDLFN